MIQRYLLERLPADVAADAAAGAEEDAYDAAQPPRPRKARTTPPSHCPPIDLHGD